MGYLWLSQSKGPDAAIPSAAERVGIRRRLKGQARGVLAVAGWSTRMPLWVSRNSAQL